MSIIRIGDRIKISQCIENGIYKTQDEMYGTLLGKPYVCLNGMNPGNFYDFYVIWPDEKYDSTYNPLTGISTRYMQKQIKTLVNERKLLLLHRDKKDLLSFAVHRDKIPKVKMGDMACWRNSYFYFFGKISCIYNKQQPWSSYSIERALCMDFKNIHDYVKYVDRKVVDYIPLSSQEVEIQEEEEIVKKKRFSLDKILANEEVSS